MGHDAECGVIEDISYHLLLRQDHAPLWRRAVDGRDENYQVALAYQVADELLRLLRTGGEPAYHLFQLIDIRAVCGADIDPAIGRFRQLGQQVALVECDDIRYVSRFKKLAKLLFGGLQFSR